MKKLTLIIAFLSMLLISYVGQATDVKVTVDGTAYQCQPITPTPTPTPTPIPPTPGADCTGVGHGTQASPWKLNNLIDGLYVREGASGSALSIPAGVKYYFEVNPGCTGQPYTSFTMWIKGFNNSADFRFSYSVVRKSDGVVLVSEKKIYQNRSLADTPKEIATYGINNIKVIYGFADVGSGTGTSEVGWTGDF